MLYAILKLFCDSETQAYWADRFRSGGLGYREVKQAIFDRFMEKFGPARARREELLRQPELLDQILKRGVQQARNRALPLLRQVRDAVGIRNYE